MIIVLCQNPEPEFRGDKQENYLKITNYITLFFKGNLAIHKCLKNTQNVAFQFWHFHQFFPIKNYLSGNTVCTLKKCKQSSFRSLC